MSHLNYFTKMYDCAKIVEDKTGIHAPLVLAFWSWESGYGTSPSSQPGQNNHGGISKDSTGNQIKNPDWNYAGYYTIENFAKDYARIFTDGPSYAAVRSADKNNYRAVTQALNSTGYAEKKYDVDSILSIAKSATEVLIDNNKIKGTDYSESAYTSPDPSNTSTSSRNVTSSIVLIKNIVKKDNKYEFTVSTNFDTKFISVELEAGEIGDVLTKAINALGINNGSSYPAILKTLSGTATYYKKDISKIDISTDQLEIVNQYVKYTAGEDIERIVSKTSSYILVQDKKPKDLEKVSYILAKVVKIIDGDTVSVNVSYANNVDFPAGYDHNNKVISIRFSGVQCLETKKDDSYAEEANAKWLKEKGLYSSATYEQYIEKTYAIAEEAKIFVTEELQDKEVFILIDNHPKNTQDRYGRLIGVIYLPSPSPSNLYDSININRTLLANESRSWPGYGLANLSLYVDSTGEVQSKFAQNYGKDVFKNESSSKSKNASNIKTSLEVFLEKHDLKLDKNGYLVYNEDRVTHVATKSYEVEEGVKIKLADIVERFNDDELYTTGEKIAEFNGYGKDVKGLESELINNSLVGTTLLIPIYKGNKIGKRDLLSKEYQSNINDIPADSEYEDYAHPISDDRDLLDGFNRSLYTTEQIDEIYDTGYTRIGDCTFMIPPLSIKVDTMAHNSKVKALRSKSSIQTQTGHSTRIITIELFFSDAEQVNGYIVDDPKLNPLIESPSYVKQTWYRNGLRPLIAQFKRAPFLPIENKLLNDSFGIMSVGMKDLQLATVPGFPGVIQATLVMYDFDHNTYIIGEEDFAGMFNWKMFRWYYQQILQERNFLAGKTYLESINTLDDSIKFYVLNEEKLAQRQEAIKKLDEMIHPMLYTAVNTDEDTEGGGKIHDAEEMQKAKLQKAVFDEWLAKHTKENYPCFYNEEGIFNGIDDSKLNAIEEEDYKWALIELFSVMYFGGRKLTNSVKEPNHIGYVNVFPEDDDNNFFFVPNNAKSLNEFFNGDTIYFYHTEVMFRKTLWDYWNDYEVYEKADPSGGFYVVRLNSLDNIMLLTTKNLLSSDQYYLSPSTDMITADKIANGAEDVQASIDNYTEGYDALKELARLDELTIQQDEFHIDGDFWIESMNASMSNDLVPLQTYEGETPTFQYVGSQDTQVNIAIRTTSKDTVKDFKNLMSTVQELARNYRVGITSGVLSIKSNLIGLVGSRDHLIQNISVETIPDDKESYRISITLTAFDRTQSAKEKLDGESIGQFLEEDNDPEEFISGYSKQKAMDDLFEYAAIDFKLRDMEVYPDLELPTYNQLNEVLPFMGIYYYDATPFMTISNPTGAKYLDPDFYLRTVTTERDIIYESLQSDTPSIYLHDNSGFEAIEKGPEPGQSSMSGPNVEFSQSTKDWIDNNLSEVYMGTYVTDTSQPATNGVFADFNSSRLTAESAKDYDYEDYLHKAKNANVRASISETTLTDLSSIDFDQLARELTLPLSEDDYLELFDDDTIGRPEVISKRIEGYKKDIINPTMFSVINEIEAQVAIYFSELPYDEKINKGEGVQIDTYTYGPSRISAPMITQQKICNVLKSMFDVNSGWKHINDTGDYPVPIIDSYGNIGVGGLNIKSGVFYSKSDIKKCAYRWRYAIARSVKYFAWCYNKAIDSASFNQDAVDNPLDWAILLYKDGRGTDNTVVEEVLYLDILNTHYYNQVLNKLATKYGYGSSSRYATPESLVDESLIDYKEEKERIEDLYDLMYLQLRNENSLKSTNPKDMKKIEKALGESVGMNLNVMKNLKAIPVIKPVQDYGNLAMETGKVYITRGNKFKDFEVMKDNELTKISKFEYLGILAIDPNDEFEKSFNQTEVLIPWKQHMKWPDWGTVEESELFLTLAAQLEFRFQDGMFLSEMEKTHKAAVTDLSYYEPFDFTQNILVIQKGASTYIREAYSEAKVDEVAKNRDFSIYSIDWSKVYKIVPLQPSTDEEEEAFKEVVNEIVKSEAIAPFIRKADDVVDSYRSSFDDMLSYDQKGRLLRAFPTFQMFLIDEGRWMFYHRLWDNFYGYNSVISIDVMKDRRMAADTAVIQLSNIYHNLNTEDEETSWGQWNNSIVDLINGTPRDKEKVSKNMFRLPDDEIIRARAEKINSLLLKPGARLHLRLGYGANAFALPIVFNGTITEMNAQEICTIVAQSDGLELTNKMVSNIKPDETTDPGLFSITREPREMICEILTSQGGFFKNLFNRITNGVFFNTHPYGIVHFGSAEVPENLVYPNILNPYTGPEHQRWGESGINVYSSNGLNTFSQWIYTEGPKKGQNIGFDWGKLWFKGDEQNVEIYLFDKTPWDIFQTYAAVSTDYIATVHPFEYRSTLFFGKPHWGIMDHYIYQYKWDQDNNYLSRIPAGGYRKAYSQAKRYDSRNDIIYNGITASATHMFNNVVGIYNEQDGAKTTKLVQVDSDIYPQFQKTALVHVPIKSAINQERYTVNAATSALRDYVKEMYQGELIVIGDPTAKPYDTVYMYDNFTDMKGSFDVKRVVHSFSHDTGYVTSISPDCISVVDDAQAISLKSWVASTLIGVTVGELLGRAVAPKLWKSMMNTTFAEAMRRYGEGGVDVIFSKMVNKSLDKALAEADSLESIIKYIKTTGDKELLDLLTDTDSLKAVKSVGDLKSLYWVKADAKIEAFKKAAREANKLNRTQISQEALKMYNEAREKLKLIDDGADVNRKIIQELQNLSKTNADEWKKIIKTVGTGEWEKGIMKGKFSDFSSLLRGTSSNYAAVSDDVGGIIKKAISSFSGIYENPSSAKGVIHTFWENSGLLPSKSWFQEKGIIKGTWNFGKNLVSKTGRLGVTTATGVTARGMRMVAALSQISWIRKWGPQIALDIAFTIITNNLIERYQRFLKSRQALTIMPLKYRGKEFTAGLEGHAGSVVGDVPSAMDKFLEGTGFASPVMSTVNLLLGVDIDYTPQEDTNLE